MKRKKSSRRRFPASRRKTARSRKTSHPAGSFRLPSRDTARAREFNTKRRGELAELAFALKATRLGFVVSKPYGDSERYDAIVDSGTLLWRVQVKCTTQLIDGVYRVNAYRRLAHGAVPYKLSEIDFFAIYILPEDSWFIVPLKAVLGMTSLFFGAKKGPKRAPFDHFREQWPLLRRPSSH